MKMLRPWPGISRDVLLALAIAGIVGVNEVIKPDPVGLVGYLFLFAGPLAVIARRVAPRLVLLATIAAQIGYASSAEGEVGPIAVLSALIALYTVVSAGHRLFAVAVMSPLVVAVVARNFGALPLHEALPNAILPVGWIVAAGVMGEVSRHRRAYLQQVEQRAADAERTREETARRRALGERLRIARELHDSLTHSISVIKVQAGVAAHLARKRGDEVPPPLLAIQDASADAMRELRETLEVLRSDTEDSSGGLARLPALIERIRAVGVPVEIATSGRGPDGLPGEVDQAAYRIIQEALTNVTRHAGPAAVQVHIEYGEAEVLLRVTDDGLARVDQATVPGSGLTGMGERVTALGGSLRAGPRPEGGFSVEADLPVRMPVAVS